MFSKKLICYRVLLIDPRCIEKTKKTSFSRRHEFDGIDAVFREIPCEKWFLICLKRMQYYKLYIAEKLRTCKF